MAGTRLKIILRKDRNFAGSIDATMVAHFNNQENQMSDFDRWMARCERYRVVSDIKICELRTLRATRVALLCHGYHDYIEGKAPHSAERYTNA